MKELIAVYNRFAETYHENRGIFDMSQIFNEFYTIINIDKGRLLDLGCGAGEPIPAMFIEKGWKVTGVDFSPKMIALANFYQPKVMTILSDISEIDFENDQFEAITAVYSLFHLEKEKQSPLFEKIYHWLKCGGKALFTYADQHYTGAESFSGYKEFMGEKLYYSHFTPPELRNILQNIGFEIIREDYREIGGEIFLWMTVGKPRKSRQRPDCAPRDKGT
ncbi:MAG TPA: class I SAM-dependent methyltransferase [Candidatus Marinimicrobia bacterium]|nr:class I SAM-dependent methyltransferase [Candidatus Neomarinimicrobiota bacterium]